MTAPEYPPLASVLGDAAVACRELVEFLAGYLSGELPEAERACFRRAPLPSAPTA